jgi:hypothetical protein
MFMSPSDRMCCWVLLRGYLCMSRAISADHCEGFFVMRRRALSDGALRGIDGMRAESQAGCEKRFAGFLQAVRNVTSRARRYDERRNVGCETGPCASNVLFKQYLVERI